MPGRASKGRDEAGRDARVSTGEVEVLIDCARSVAWMASESLSATAKVTMPPRSVPLSWTVTPAEPRGANEAIRPMRSVARKSARYPRPVRSRPRRQGRACRRSLSPILEPARITAYCVLAVARPLGGMKVEEWGFDAFHCPWSRIEEAGSARAAEVLATGPG